MWNLFKKNNKKMENNNQEINLENINEELKFFAYKWIKGENKGKICFYENVSKDPSSGVVWVNFKDGSRIDYNLLNEFMIQLEPNFNNEIETKEIDESAVKKIDFQSTKNIMVGNSFVVKDDFKENPIILLLQKQKPNWVEVGITLKLNLPNKDLYNILTSSFDDAEEQIIEFVVKDLDIELIKESLRINIKKIYKNEENLIRKNGIFDYTQNQE